MDICATTEKSLRYIKGKKERQKIFLINTGDYIRNKKNLEKDIQETNTVVAWMKGWESRKAKRLEVCCGKEVSFAPYNI